MSALVWFVVLYMAVTIAIGLWAARRVHNSKDYLVAGRSLPLYMSVATVFATWFGAETVLAVSSTFVKDGLRGIVADPFGFSLCLILVAVFFARAFYRMDLLTIGDFYRKRYGHAAELVTSLCITISYLGWTSAQMIALGLVFNMLSGGAISDDRGDHARRRLRARLHAVRRHVVGGVHRHLPDRDHRGRDALPRLAAGRHGGRGRRRDRARHVGGEVRVLARSPRRRRCSPSSPPSSPPRSAASRSRTSSSASPRRRTRRRRYARRSSAARSTSWPPSYRCSSPTPRS